MTVNKSMPLFLSAPRVILSIDNALIGMAIGLNFNLSVDVQPIYTMGSYGPAALEPTFYNVVTGTIQIIRLSRPAARKAYIDSSDKEPENEGKTKSTALDWNGKTQGSADGVAEPSTTSPSVIGSNFLYSHLDPALVQLSRLFDMSIKVKVATSAIALDKDGVQIKDSAGNPTYNASVSLSEQHWMAIRGCRITGRTTNITFGQIINEPLNFSGLLVSPVGTDGADTWAADNGITDS